MQIFIAPPIEERRDPCNPTPCGANTICREQNGAGSCSCKPDFIGDPYTGCRPECTISSECPKSQACINNKCKDPCPGTCGINAECTVINHNPVCTCMIGFEGEPSRSCRPIEYCE